MSNKKLLIFNGSPRKKGTSFSFARTIKILAEAEGSRADIIHIIEYLDEGRNLETLRKSIVDSDIIVLSSPLYVDSLPYPVIWFFERLAQEMEAELKGKSFFAIGQCAFPYPELVNTLLENCRCFAELSQMKWMGGLPYGGGVMLDGKHLEDLGKKGDNIISAFKLSLRNILNEKAIPDEARDMLKIKFPKIMARPMAAFLNHSIKKGAAKRGHNMEAIYKKAYLE